MNTNDIPKVHPELLDALHRQDEQAQQMKLSEGFTEKVMKKISYEEESLTNARKLRAAAPLHHGRGRGWVFFSRKVAAIFLAATFVGGLSFAAYRVFAPQSDSPQPTQVTTPLPHREGLGGESPVRFSDIRLDSILNVISAHYGIIVCFRSEEPRSMKLITTWNPEDSLNAFIDHLNMFDYLHLTLRGDTIFVEQTGEED